MRGGVRPGGEIVGFVDDEILDLARLTRAGAAALGEKIGVDRDVVYVAEICVLLGRPADSALRQHSGGERYDHQSQNQQHADIYAARPLFAAVCRCNLQSAVSLQSYLIKILYYEKSWFSTDGV